MKITDTIVYTIIIVALLQVRGVALAKQSSPVQKAMLMKLIAPDKSEHLAFGTAHRLGLRLEQLPEVVGAIKQSNVVIGELSPCWGSSQQAACRTKETFKGVEIAVASAIAQLKAIDVPIEAAGQWLLKLQAISRNIDKLKKNDRQWHSLASASAMANSMTTPNMQVVEDGRAKINIGDTEVYFNPGDKLEALVVQLLASGLHPLVKKLSLPKQDVGESRDKQSDPEIVYPDQSRRPTAEQLGPERLDKLRIMLQQYSDNPIANILYLTLKHQQPAHITSSLNAIAIREASKAYGEALDPDVPTLDAQIVTTLMGIAKKYVALEEIDNWQEHINAYYSQASEHFRTLDSFIGTTKRLEKIIDNSGISAMTEHYKKFFSAYFEGDIYAASLLPQVSTFNPFYEDIVLDQRNLKWMEDGKIEEHCTKDNQCLVFVGFSHLLRGKSPLFKLLQDKGFTLRELTADERRDLHVAASTDGIGNTYKADESDVVQDSKKSTPQQSKDILIEAASSKDLKRAKNAIAQGVDEHYLGQALLETVVREDLDMVKLLTSELAKGSRDNYYEVINKVMAIAATQNNIPIVEFLVSKGANDYNQALKAASYMGSIKLVKYLLAQGADGIADALANALFKGHIELVEFLIPLLKKTEVSENFTSILNNSLLWAVGAKKIKIIELLVQVGANDFNNLLRHAANAGDMERVEFAVKKGADNYAEAFLQAVYNEHENIAKYLFDLLQQKPEAINVVGSRAFSYALHNDNTKLAKFLVRENIVSIDVAATLVLEAQQEDIVDYIVQQGVNDSSWSNSMLVLLQAAAEGRVQTVATILKELNLNPHEALLTAVTNGRTEIVKFILQIGVSVDSLRIAHELALIYEHNDDYNKIIQLLHDSLSKLEADGLMTASPRVKKFFAANISLATEANNALAQKIVSNNMQENNVAFTRLDNAVKAAGGWQALAVAMQGLASNAQARFTNSLVQAVVAGKDEQLLSEVVRFYRLISAMQKLEEGKNQKHARSFGLGDRYSYSLHLQGKRDFNYTTMRARIATLRQQYADNQELQDIFDEIR